MSLLSIGEFSKLTRLSVKALRLYGELELLPPEQVDHSSGYRYYSFSQAPRAWAIALLRSLEMPLADIKQLLDETDQDKFRVLLDRHRALLEERLADHERMLARVERLISEGALDMTLQVTIKQMEPVTVCGLEFTCPVEQVSEQSGRAYQRLFGALAKTGAVPPEPPRLVYLDDTGPEWRLEANVPIRIDGPPDPDMIVRQMPGAKVASVMHRGPYDELGRSWSQLEAWITEHGHDTAGPVFDIYHTDPAETPDPADYETELCWPIR